MSIPQKSKREHALAHTLYGICAITLVRIKVTTNITAGYNMMQDSAILALLTCLEAVLGIINACLPLLKPIVSKVGASGLFSLFRTKTPSATSCKHINTPRYPRTDHSWREGNKPLRIGPSRAVVQKESLEIYSPDLPADVRAPSIPLPSFSRRPRSKFSLPRAEWEQDGSDLRKDSGTITTTTTYVVRRSTEDDSPTLPWQPWWDSDQEKAIERC